MAPALRLYIQSERSSHQLRYIVPSSEATAPRSCFPHYICTTKLQCKVWMPCQKVVPAPCTTFALQSCPVRSQSHADDSYTLWQRPPSCLMRVTHSMHDLRKGVAAAKITFHVTFESEHTTRRISAKGVFREYRPGHPAALREDQMSKL